MRAAQLLTEAGHNLSVFEKSAGTGGRLACGRLGEDSADLGTALIEARSAEFEHWLVDNGAQPWQAHAATLRLDPVPDRAGWVAVPRSSSLTRRLAETVELHTGIEVGVVWPDREGVLLRDRDGEALGHFDAAIVATPAPQAAKLLDAIHRFRMRAEQTDVSPVWSLLVSLSQRPTRLNRIDWLEEGHPVLQRIVRDSSKPQRRGENWVVQATENWSRARLDLDPAQVSEILLSAFAEIAGEPLHPLHIRVHRWLYARALPGRGELALWDRQSGIGACGDWLCGGGVEGAWISANELVARMLGTVSKVA